MAQKSGLRIAAGGNLGSPALDLLDGDVQLYILELSSFQLETTQSLKLAAATVLNVTPDHMDRYADLDSYARAKARIFAHCDVAVINLDDPLVAAMPRPGQRALSFSLRADVGADFALRRQDDGEWWLMRGDAATAGAVQHEDQWTAQCRECTGGARAGRGVGLPQAAVRAGSA
jgi:UDP-N-acetylmuramoylalanine--D-glutamate ligase